MYLSIKKCMGIINKFRTILIFLKLCLELECLFLSAQCGTVMMRGGNTEVSTALMMFNFEVKQQDYGFQCLDI